MIVCDDWEVMSTDVYACMCMSGDVQHFALCLTTTLWYLVMKAIVETLFSTGGYVYLTVSLAFNRNCAHQVRSASTGTVSV